MPQLDVSVQVEFHTLPGCGGENGQENNCLHKQIFISRYSNGMTSEVSGR